MRLALRCLGLVLSLASLAWSQVPSPDGRSTTGPPAQERGSGERGGRGFSRANREPLDPAEQARREERAKMARDLLELSYSIGATLPASERAKVLPRQILIASSVDAKLAAQWAEEALPFARELPPGDDQDAIYASAIPALVSSDTETALEVFRTLPPETASGPAFTFAVQRLFSSLVREQGARGMELVRQEALRLAQSTYYPYSAVLAAAQELRTGDNQLREAFFYEAASAYQQGNRSPAGDAEFARMLMREWPQVPRPAAQAAFQSLIDNLLARAQREEQEAMNAASSAAPASSANRSSALNSADNLLSRLLPMLRRFDPQLQQKVLQARPALANSGQGRGRGGPTAGLFPPGGGLGASPSQSPQEQMRQQQGLVQYTQARRNPTGALAVSTALSDPYARTLALVGAASGLVRTDPAGADTALQQALDAASQITDPAQQLQAAVTMINVTAQMGNSPALRAILERGFRAAEVLQQSDDATEVSRAQFTLEQLVRSGFQQDPALALAFVDQVRMPTAKAALLLQGAQALSQGRGRGGAAPRGGGNAAPAQTLSGRGRSGPPAEGEARP